MPTPNENQASPPSEAPSAERRGQLPAPSQKRLLSLALGIACIDSVALNLIVPSLPFFAIHLGASAIIVGSLVTVYLAANALSSILFGYFEHKIGTRLIIVAGLFTSIVSLIGLMFTFDLFILFFFRCLGGFAAGRQIAFQAVVGRLTPEQERAKAFGWLIATTGVGTIVGPGLGSALSYAGAGFTILLGAAATLTSVALILAWLLLPHSHENRSPSSDALTNQQYDNYSALIFRRDVQIACVSVFFGGFAIYTLLSMTAIFTNAVLGWSSKEVGALLAFNGVVFLVVQVLAIKPLASRLPTGMLVTFSMAIMALGLTVISLSKFPITIYFSYALFSVGMALFLTFSRTLISQLTSSGRQGHAMALYQTVSLIGQLLSPIVAGYVFSDISIYAPFLLGAALLIAWTMCQATLAANQT